MSLTESRETIEQLKSQLREAEQTVRRERRELWKSKQDYSALVGAQKVLQTIAQNIQQTVHERVARIVSNCLVSVFGDEAYTFRIDFEKKRGKTEARLLFERDSVAIDPLASSGGGVVDVAAFALRLAALLMQNPPDRRILVLDEPFRFLSVEYRQALVEILNSLSDEMGVQIIIVTHTPDLEIGKVIRL